MITLYSGTPGSGKSLYACAQIIDALYADKLVICNFPVTLDHVGRLRRKLMRGMVGILENSDMRPARMVELSRAYWGDNRVREGRILLVIDEASTIFNPRDWGNKDRMDWLTFFAQHRKLGFDVILISQSDAQLDKQIRPCIEVERRFRCSSQFMPWLPIKLFCFTDFYYGQSKTKSNALRTSFFRYHSFWGSIYDTMALFSSPTPPPVIEQSPKKALKGKKS